jgi:hypothetical protein
MPLIGASEGGIVHLPVTLGLCAWQELHVPRRDGTLPAGARAALIRYQAGSRLLPCGEGLNRAARA